MRYVDESRLKDFNFESVEAPEVVVVPKTKSHARRVFEDIAVHNPKSRRHVAFSMFCALSADTTGRFREELNHQALVRGAREHQVRLRGGSHRALPRP